MSANQPTKLETLFGGIDYTATLSDGSTEAVRIRQAPVAEYQRAALLDGDEFALVDWYCDKPRGWSLNLCPGSFDHIATEGARVNGHFFAYCRRLESKALNRLKAMAPDRLEQMIGKMLPSSTTSPTSFATPRSTPESP